MPLDSDKGEKRSPPAARRLCSLAPDMLHLTSNYPFNIPHGSAERVFTIHVFYLIFVPTRGSHNIKYLLRPGFASPSLCLGFSQINSAHKVKTYPRIGVSKPNLFRSLNGHIKYEVWSRNSRIFGWSDLWMRREVKCMNFHQKNLAFRRTESAGSMQHRITRVNKVARIGGTMKRALFM